MSVGSGIEGLRADSVFARFVANQLKTENFQLIDIGCAGGPAPGWRAFGDRLAAICIDGNADEIARLKAEESNPRVQYRAGLVGVPADHPLQEVIRGRGRWTEFGFGRLACERHDDLRAAQAEGRQSRTLVDYLQTHAAEWRNARPPLAANIDYAHAFKVYTPSADEIAAAREPDVSSPIYLPAFAAATGFDDADFLKIDIDGPDYEVLRSATNLLQRPSLLGAALEVSFFGSHHANDNTFHNVDRLMREKGFDLFALSTRGYASAALPSPYLSAYPSLNATGRPMQGDAVYLRDLSSTVRWADSQAVSSEKLAKLAALFSLFGLPDQAAEMLIVHRERIGALLDCDEGLELLTHEVQQGWGAPELTYADYIAAFESEHPNFFDVYSRRETWLAAQVRAAQEQPRLLARIEALEAEIERLKPTSTAGGFARGPFKKV